MPESARFFGIVVKMNFGDTDHHQAPHVHAEYQGDTASIGIPGGEVLAGSLPRKQLRRVQARSARGGADGPVGAGLPLRTNRQIEGET